MPYIRFGVPSTAGSAPQSGVCLRLGDDPGDETVYPTAVDGVRSLQHAADGSYPAYGGIYLQSDGAFTLNAAKCAFRDYDGSLNQELYGTGGYGVTVAGGDMSISLDGDATDALDPTGARTGSLKIEPSGSMTFRATAGDIKVTAANGKVSDKASTSKKYTNGFYGKYTGGTKASRFIGSKLSISMTLTLCGYMSAFLEFKTLSLGFKVLGLSSTALSFSAGLFKMKVGVLFYKIAGLDDKYAFVYVKYRGVQAEQAIFNGKGDVIDKEGDVATYEEVTTYLAKRGISADLNTVRTIFPG